MQIHFVQMLVATTALAAGTAIGLAFGSIQEAASRRYHLMQSAGKLSNGWGIVPGSMQRTAYFLVILAGVQLLCPLLFTNGCQWWVFGGVAAGYGWSLWKKLRLSLDANRAR